MAKTVTEDMIDRTLAILAAFGVPVAEFTGARAGEDDRDALRRILADPETVA